MQRKAAFFDVDGTLTNGRVWRGIMEYFQQLGERRLTHVLFWARHMPIYLAFKVGLVDQSAFRRPWAANLAWYLRGYSVEEAQAIWDYVVEEYLPPLLRPDTLQLIRQHNQAGDLVVLVSAGPTPLQERIAAAVGADLAVGTDPEVLDGRYSGRSRGPVCMDEYKPLLTLDKLSALGIEVDLAASQAYADSAGDVGLLEMAGHPVALQPGRPPAADRRGARMEDCGVGA